MEQVPMTPEDEKKAAAAGKIIQSESDLKSAPVEDIRTVKFSYHGLKEWPNDIKRDSPAGVVFSNLNICYKHAGNVSESLVGNIIWGFRQSGIPDNVCYDGLKELLREGYMSITDKAGIKLFGPDIPEDAWYKWEPKFLRLLLDSPGKEASLETKGVPQDNTVEGIED